MAKRSDFKKRPMDAYDTPIEAVVPLFNFLERGTTFIEPCAGKGDLIRHLESVGFSCIQASDIEPRAIGIQKADYTTYKDTKVQADYFITNPPWTRQILHPMIHIFRKEKPTWLLFDADWMHTRQAAPYLPFCSTILSVGRVKWIADSKHTGKDNACWYLFVKDTVDITNFIGRV